VRPVRAQARRVPAPVRDPAALRQGQVAQAQALDPAARPQGCRVRARAQDPAAPGHVRAVYASARPDSG